MIDFGNLTRPEVEELIDLWIFNERHREILKRRLLDGVCYEPLAEEFDLSVSQIKNIIRVGQNKLFSK